MGRAGVLAVLVFLAGAAWFAAAAARRPLVLVVDSYAIGLPWARGTRAGVAEVLDPARDVRVRRISLDAGGLEGAPRAARAGQARALIAASGPAAIILMDDVAQRELGSTLAGAYRGVLIAGGIAAHGPGTVTLDGIAEQTPWPAVQDLLGEFGRQRGIAVPRVALINDTGAAGDEEAAGFTQHRWQGMQRAGVWRCADQAQWAAALAQLRTRADLVIVGGYADLALPAGLSPLAARRAVAASTLDALRMPVLALSGYAVADGLPVALLPSPREQGRQAALMALASLRGQPVPAAPSPGAGQFLVLADERALSARAMLLPELYASYARQARALFQAPGTER